MIHKYRTPKILKLGTKGSKGAVNAYCYIPFEFAGVQDGKLCPTVDLRWRNKNMKKQKMPALDPDGIRNELARHYFKRNGDVKGAFQQVRIVLTDLWKTPFNTPNGIYVTPVSQQGDTNLTVTLAMMMAHILSGLVGRCLLYYADNIFGYADSWSEYWENTITNLQGRREHEWYLNKNTIEICPERTDVLGMRVGYKSISIDPKKRDAILAFEKPTNEKEVQRFVGSVEWISQFIRGLADLGAPLSYLCGVAPF